MAATTISTVSISTAPSFSSPSSSSLPTRLSLQSTQFHSQNPVRSTNYCSYKFPAPLAANRQFSRIRRTRAVAEEAEQSVADGEIGGGVEESPPPKTTVDQSVSVQVSPSDVLTMFFRAEGTMNETAIPTVTQALEGTEGITDLKVQVLEGIASVELTKQTTVQATGVASGLLETIQGSGFKLQTLNLSFQDDEDIS